MITFEKDQFTITVKDRNIAERWVYTVHELLDLLYCKDEAFIGKHQNIVLLLQEMMPVWQQVRAMHGIPPEAEDK